MAGTEYMSQQSSLNMGADQDAVEVANDLGVRVEQTVTSSRDESCEAMTAMSGNVRGYRAAKIIDGGNYAGVLRGSAVRPDRRLTCPSTAIGRTTVPHDKDGNKVSMQDAFDVWEPHAVAMLTQAAKRYNGFVTTPSSPNMCKHKRGLHTTASS